MCDIYKVSKHKTTAESIFKMLSVSVRIGLMETASQNTDIVSLREGLICRITDDAIRHGVVIVALRGADDADDGLTYSDMLLAIEDDLLSFRMNAHGRIAWLAYEQGLHGAVSAETVSKLEEKFGGVANFYTDPKDVRLYKREGRQFVAA